MILVTVGTEQFPFERLLLWVERAIQNGSITEEVLIQSGACTVTVRGATQVKWLQPEAFDQAINHARLVINHCGEGTFSKLRTLGKPFLPVARRHGLGEHIDDHQCDLANALVAIDAPVARTPQDVERFVLSPPTTDTLKLPGDSLTDHLLSIYPPSLERTLASV
jgi:UDP-N-acetylglucosamine transferase subunit ALG13